MAEGLWLRLNASVFLLLIAVASHEFLDAASGVNNLLGARVERVGEAADFKAKNKVVDTIDIPDLVRLVCRNAGPFVLAVDKEHRVVCGMRVSLHFVYPSIESECSRV